MSRHLDLWENTKGTEKGHENFSGGGCVQFRSNIEGAVGQLESEIPISLFVK